MSALFHALSALITWFQPYLSTLCFIAAWLLVGLMIWNAWVAVSDAIARSKTMHQIPCSNCQFFTGDYHLKCTVHPITALTEEAIGCQDHQPMTNPYTANPKNLSGSSRPTRRR